MKRTNRLNFWENELNKYGEFAKNRNSQTPTNPDSATFGISKTQGKRTPTVTPTNPLDRYKDFTGIDKSGTVRQNPNIIGIGAGGGKTNGGGIIDNSNLEKFPTIDNGTNSGGAGSYNPKTIPSLLDMPTTPKTTPSTSPTIPSDSSMTKPTGGSTTDTAPSNRFSAKYQGTDFLEWYKANYGQDYEPSTILSRRNGMSDVDWDIGNSLYDTYRKDQQRKSDYESRVSALDKSKMQSQQNASITLDKLKKYIPTQIKAQGLGGLGVSESSLLNAYNNYSSDMGAIENDYQDRKSSLEEAYAQDNLQSWQTSKDSVSGIFDGYKSAFENNQKQAYQDAYNTVSQSTETNESAILKYIEQFRNRLSDSDFLTLTQQAIQVAQANKQAYDKEQVAKTEQQQKSTYEDAKENIKNLPFTSQEEMDRYIERFRGQVTEGQLNRLFGDGIDRVLENQKSKEEQDKADTYSEIYGTAKEYIDKQDYDNAIKYLEANKELLGRQYDVLMSQINLEKETEKEKERYSDYFKINKLPNGNDIKALRDINTRYNVKPADSENLEFQIEAGDNIYGVKLGDTVASSDQADVKKYMYSAYGRKPQAGDLCYYAGQIVVVCQNGNLRYLKDAPNFLGTWNWWGVKHLEDLVNLVNVDYD